MEEGARRLGGGELAMEEGGDGEQAPGPRKGQLRRRRARRARKKDKAGAAGESSAAEVEPHGSRDAEGDTAGGDAVQAAPPRAGEQSGDGGGRGELNGADDQKRLHLGGLAGPNAGRNGGVGEERPGLGRVQPPQRGALARGHGGAAAGSSHATLGAEDGDEVAGEDSNAGGDQQATGSSPVGAGGKDAVFPRDEAAAEEDGHNGDGLGGATVTGAADSEQRATASTLLSQSADDIKDGLNADMHKGKKKKKKKAKGKGTKIATAATTTGPNAGRNGGVHEEKTGLGRVQPPQREEQQGALAGAGGHDGAAADEDGVAGAGEDSNASDGGDLARRKRLGIGGLGDEQVQHGDQQATGSSPPIGAGEEDALFPRDKAAANEDDHNQQSNNGSGGGAIETNGEPELRTCAADTPSTLLSQPLQSGDQKGGGLDLQLGDHNRGARRGKNENGRAPASNPVRGGEDGMVHGNGDANSNGGRGSEGCRGGDDGNVQQDRLGLAASLGVLILGGGGQPAPMDSRRGGVPVPPQSDGGGGGAAAATSQQLATGAVELAAGTSPIASPPSAKLLKRSTFLSDAVLSWSVSDVLDENLYRDQVQQIPVEFESPEHYANVYSTLLLEETSFLSNISGKMEISEVLSLRDECDKKAVQTLQEMFRKVGKRCNDCCQSLHCKDASAALPIISSLSSNLNCPHEEYTGVVCAPPGTLKGCISVLMKEFIRLRKKVLICLPKETFIPEFLIDMEEILSPSGKLDGVLVLNSVSCLGTSSTFEKTCLENKSQEVYSYLEQCTGWLKWMSSILELKAFNHSPRCPAPTECTQCKLEITFSVRLFTERFTDIVMKLRECLFYLLNNAPAICLPDVDSNNILNLLDLMDKVKVMLHSTDLTNDSVIEEFGLNLISEVVAMDTTDYRAKSLNEHRISSVKLIDALIQSLQLPHQENRDELDKFCIQQSIIIVTSLDCMGKLHGLELGTFDITIVTGAGQITESDLLVPFVVPMRHIVFFGDHLHLQPFVQSKIIDDPSVEFVEYNKEFTSLELPAVSFINVPSLGSKSKYSRKCDISFAAIVMLLLDLGTDTDDLICANPNSLNVALTSSRTLIRSGGITWNKLETFVKKQDLILTVDSKLLIQPGQEQTWDGRPIGTKNVLADVRDQRGQPDTCVLQSTSAAGDSLMKLHNANLTPPQDCKWTLSVDDFKKKHEKGPGKKFTSEDIADRGKRRFVTAFERFKEHGVEGRNKCQTKVVKLSAYKEIVVDSKLNPESSKDVRNHLENGNILVGSFRLSMNYYNLRPGEVYVYDEKKPIKHPKSNLLASHAVMMIGIGYAKIPCPMSYFRHMCMQNSEGQLFGINGLGRVAKNSVTALYQIELEKPPGKVFFACKLKPDECCDRNVPETWNGGEL
ncbi:hypothetical protein PR202_gb13625 [Eleusine coracana subsp. coracana]|uniref:DNA2/NAM7 helicase helicase domain-containing protein n=1 Tax=Eleusine coracana subsp. coracana TaxID=191504 RepID=A0AAV5EU80_ELECO|nr:hypothetical protein PR202_gb13625 [Eleusine coracana subsp. coracana]